jgi:GNAT superfamily N-acetyltransferase
METSIAQQNAPAREPAPIQIRPVRQADTGECARIIFEAFFRLAERHHFPPDFPSIDVAAGLANHFIGHPSIFGVVAESGGRVVGSNFLIEHDEIRGVGPITVDPSMQRKSIGRALMQAVLDRARAINSVGVRLVQDSFNTASLSLYNSLGFDAREPLALIRGTPTDAGRLSGGYDARPLTEQDLPACAALCRSVHGIERSGEIRDILGSPLRPIVLLRGGEIVGYATAPRMWVLNHGVAETEADMQALLLAAAADGPDSAEPLSFLLPIRQADLLRWCLGQGLRVVKPMTLMSLGRYEEPRGCYYPSVLY